MSLIPFTAEGSDLQELIKRGDTTGMRFLQGLIRRGTETPPCNDNVFLDMLTVVDVNGKVLYRAANPEIRGDNLLNDPLIRNFLEKKNSVSSTELMSIKYFKGKSRAFGEGANEYYKNTSGGRYQGR